MHLCISPGTRPARIKGSGSKEGADGCSIGVDSVPAVITYAAGPPPAELERNRSFQSSNSLRVARMFSDAIC
jgi:hypothetical protein